MFERKSHWESIYTTKAPTEVSWFQQHPEISLEIIGRTGIDQSAEIIDVGGGASTLLDDLLSQGFRHVTVLDVASAAIERSKARLGERAGRVTWIEADITQVSVPQSHYDLWHDRAVFHFLTHPHDRQSYVSAVNASLKQGGHLIVATFAPDGPRKCSGLETVRYSSDELQNEFGDNFRLIESVSELHHTPFDTVQKFNYCYFQKK